VYCLQPNFAIAFPEICRCKPTALRQMELSLLCANHMVDVSAMPKRTLLLFFILLCIGVALLTVIYRGCIGSSASRITREHGLALPTSASHFVCKGDAWIMVMDRGAASAFEMASNDVPRFLAQLKIKEAHNGDYSKSVFPGNPQYQVRTRWMSGSPLETYHCASPVGDLLDVQIWPIDAAHVGVCLYTDWN
jgi:hypothetical protein